MPCYSRVTTQIKDRTRLVDALKAQGFTIIDQGEMYVGTRQGLSFSRSNAQETFTASAPDSIGRTLAEVGRKYAELGVRSWARGRGLVVRSADEKAMTLVSTRS